MLGAVASLITGDSGDFTTDEPILTQYAAALSGSAPAELMALEKLCRSLNLYVNLGDAEGQVQACDMLCEMCRTITGGSLLGSRAVLACRRTTSLSPPPPMPLPPPPRQPPR